jgi:hypothetical protein
MLNGLINLKRGKDIKVPNTFLDLEVVMPELYNPFLRWYLEIVFTKVSK